MDIQTFFDSRKKIALQFSGGKDSSACLWLLEEYWPWLDVIWIDTGDSPPEQLAYMEDIASLVPNFKRIQSDSVAWRKVNGNPVDFFPSFQGAFNGPKLVSTFECCSHNMWHPMAKFLNLNKYDGVVQGSKKCDPLHNGIANGDYRDGMQYFLPIFDWNDDLVIEYLGDRLPGWYKSQDTPKSSSDCKSCSAYLHENRGPACDSTRSTHEFMIKILDDQLNALRNTTYRKSDAK
jgi:3'-phosphoadenosine 5'-phosphosulfate sulfotransferase (PAPS reductase)/FAD synthetase